MNPPTFTFSAIDPSITGVSLGIKAQATFWKESTVIPRSEDFSFVVQDDYLALHSTNFRVDAIVLHQYVCAHTMFRNMLLVSVLRADPKCLKLAKKRKKCLVWI